MTDGAVAVVVVGRRQALGGRTVSIKASDDPSVFVFGESARSRRPQVSLHTDPQRDFRYRLYGWFTEGFDTADPKEAKALLDELG